MLIEREIERNEKVAIVKNIKFQQIFIRKKREFFSPSPQKKKNEAQNKRYKRKNMLCEKRFLFRLQLFFFLPSPFSIVWKVIWYHETLSSILFTRNANSQLAIFKFSAMSARFGKNQTHDDDFPERFYFAFFLFSREIIPRYSLRNESSCLKIFSSDSPTHLA